MTDYDKNSWITPPHIIELARQVMGSIDLDPAAGVLSQTVVKATRYYQREGEQQPWRGNVWLNPPYGRGLLDPFVVKAVSREADQCIVLVNATITGTVYGQLLLKNCDRVCFTEGRLAFLHPETLKPVPGNNAAQTLYYFGAKTEAFAESFAEIGAVLRGD